MTYSVESLLRGQHFYTGLRVAIGLLGLALGVYCVAGITVAVVAASGAICTSAADLPSPLRHKPRELLASLLISSGVYLLIAAIRTMPGMLGLGIIILSFLIALAVAYGPKAGPIGFAGTFAMVMALGGPASLDSQVWHFSMYFFIGGCLYALYGCIAARFLVYRTKQQMFAECCFELSRYLRIKAGFYEKNAPLDALYLRIAGQQAIVAAKQQATRDFLFRDIYSDRDARLARLFMMQVDLFEYILAGNTDYELLQQHYSGSDIMLFLRDLMYKCAKGIDGIAYTALRSTPMPHRINYKAELFAIEYDLDKLSYDRTQDLDALTMLIDSFDKVILGVEAVEDIERVQNSPLEQRDPTVTVRLSLFTSPSHHFSPKLIWDNLTLRSAHFRYALRATIAMGTGYATALVLNWFMPGVATHGHWILITISVVLCSNFSMTVQRRTDRIIGTAAGCALTAALLYTSPPLALLVAGIFIAQVGVETFITINYRYSAAAATIVTLLQIYLINPDAGFVFSERLLDTVVGALLAYVCSFIFPSWEYRSLPQLVHVLSQANARYAQDVLNCSTVADEEYRLARKSLFDSMAELSGAFERMQHEPMTPRKTIGETGRFITLNALFSARIASIHLLLKRLAERPVEDVVAVQLDEAQEKMRQLFSFAREGGAPDVELCFAPAAEISGGQEGSASVEDTAAATHVRALSDAAMHKMDYSDQHVVSLLQKQLDSALTLAAEIRSFHLDIYDDAARNSAV